MGKEQRWIGREWMLRSQDVVFEETTLGVEEPDVIVFELEKDVEEPEVSVVELEENDKEPGG